MTNLQLLASKYKLILGSASPRRRELLSRTGIEFDLLFPEIVEERIADEEPIRYAERLAREKALSIGLRSPATSLIIGADTIVILKDRVLEKPADESEALNMLKALSGNRHEVCTALSIVSGDTVLASGSELTAVLFCDQTEEKLRDYIKYGEPMDKAGAYGIQGMGGFLVDRIEGNLDTVIGLPLGLLDKLAGKVLEQL